jgi:hypothetical protein
MLHAQKTTENGQKTRFSTLPDCFGQTAAEMRPPIFLSTENTLVYIRHLFLGQICEKLAILGIFEKKRGFSTPI